MIDSKRRVRVQCLSCDTTGLYQGKDELPGSAVICRDCGGQGWRPVDYSEFNGRRRRVGIQTVFKSGGGSAGMSYAEFEKRVPVRG